MTPDPLLAPQDIQILFLHFDTEHPAPVRAQLLSVAPTFETLGHVLAGTITSFDAGFMDVVGFSCAPAALTGSTPTPIYPCGSEVYRLGPILFAGLADELKEQSATGLKPTELENIGGTMHNLATLSLISLGNCSISTCPIWTLQIASPRRRRSEQGSSGRGAN